MAQTLGNLHRRQQFGFGEHQAEFFAAKARRHVVLPQMLQQNLGHLHQHHIPLLMTVGIVDPFEMVDIDHDQREGGVAPGAALELFFQGLHQAAAIAEVGQGIGVGESQQL